MISVFIPFFLTTQIAVDDGAWRYGPQYTYQVTGTVTSQLENQEAAFGSSHVNARLICRPDPRNEDALICRLKGGRLYDYGQVFRDSGIVVTADLSVSEEPFLLLFDNRGLRNIVVPGSRKFPAAQLNAIRNIVDLLNVGADLHGRPDGTFRVYEKMVFGECVVSFNVSRELRRESHEHKGKFHLQSLPQLNKVTGEVIEIEKERHLGNCTRRPCMYMETIMEKDSHSDQGDDNDDDDDDDDDEDDDDNVIPNIRSSVNRMTISDKSFASESTTSGLVYIASHGRKYAMTQREKLTLLSVDPAADELPFIPQPGITDVIVNSEVQDVGSSYG